MMNKRNLARQALRYIAALKQPLPEASDADFYTQNSSDYEALLTLNKKGLGTSEDDLLLIADAPFTDAELNRIVKRLKRVDELILAEHVKEEKIDRDPKYWDGFFSGYEASPTRRCEQLMRGIKSRVNKLSSELSELFNEITMQQAMDFGYCCDGMNEDDFKSNE